MSGMQINDEILCAYLDGALDAPTRAGVEAALDADPGARLRLENMRQADEALRSAFPLPGGDGFEAMLSDRIRVRSPVRRTVSRVIPWALAASIAGAVVGYLAPRPGAEGLPATINPALAAALDSQRSGTAGAQGVQVLLSFQAADGRYCRLFRAGESQGVGEGLACRQADHWKLAAWDASAPTASDGYRTAGASALVDGAMSALGGSPALSNSEEEIAVARQWRQP